MAAAAVTEAANAANLGDVFEAAEVSDAAAEATDDAMFCCCDTFDEGQMALPPLLPPPTLDGGGAADCSELSCCIAAGFSSGKRMAKHI